MQREKRRLLPNVPVNEINVRFRKKKNQTPKTKILTATLQDKKEHKAISKYVSVQVSVASENCDL